MNIACHENAGHENWRANGWVLRVAVSLVGGLMMLVAGGSQPAAAAELLYPVHTAVGSDGRFYVVDQDLPGIWLVTNGKPEIFFRASKKFRTPLNAVRCVAFDPAGKLIAGDAATYDLYRFPEKDKPEPVTGGKVRLPVDLGFDAKGNCYISDAEMQCLWKLPAGSKTPERVASIPGPRGLAVAEDGTVWILSLRENPLRKITPDGKETVVLEGRPFQFPNDVALGRDGTAFVSDGYASAVWKVEPSGKVSKWVAGKPLVRPLGLTWHQDRLVITDPHAKNLFLAAPDGTLTPVVK